MATDIIRLPSERADQLRELARHKGITIAELIGQLATVEIKRLGLHLQIGLGQTVDFARLENGNIHADLGLGVMHWTDEQMGSVIAAIETALAKKGGTLDMGAGISVTRVGTSIKITNIETGAERTLADSIAKELVALMRATS